MPNRKYRAFISYSQRDARYARKIHRALEAYRVPRRLRTHSEDQYGKVGRFFRDDDEMGAVSDLGASLRGAIEDSESLIVIASPNAAQSRWVNEEILHFKRTGRAENIFAVIVGGTPHAANSKIAEAKQEECFPPALRFEIDERGELYNQPSEPLGIDFRKEPFSRLVVRLVSGLLETPFDSLWQRQRRRHRQRVLLGAVAGLAALVLVCGTLVFQMRNTALGESTALTAAAATANRAARSDLIEPDRQAGPERALRLAVLAAQDNWLRPINRRARSELARATANMRTVRRIETGFSTIKQISYSANGELLLITGTQKLAAIDPTTGRALFTYSDTGGRPARGKFLGDSTDILIFEDDRLLLVDGRNGDVKTRFEGHQTAVDIAVLALDQPQLFTRGADGQFRVWDSESGDHVATVDMAGWRVRSVVFDAAKTPLWVTDDIDTNSLYIWDGNTGAERAVLSGHGDFVSVVRSSPNGAMIATGTGYRDGSVRVWSLESQELLTRFEPHGSGVADVKFSPDSQLLISLAQDATQRNYLAPLGAQNRPVIPELHVLNVARSKQMIELKGHQNLINSVAWSPDSRSIFTTSDDTTARIWNARSGRETLRLEGHTAAIRDADFSPDGMQVATADNDGTIIIWDVAEAYAEANKFLTDGEIAGRQRQLLLEGLAWTGREIDSAVSGYRVTENATGELVVEHDKELHAPITLQAEPPIGDSILLSVAFSPNGNLVVTASADGSIRLFEVHTGLQLSRIRGKPALLDIFDPNKAPAATFTGDGLGIYAIGIEDYPIYWNIRRFADDDTRSAAGMAPLLVAVCDNETGMLPRDLRRLTAEDVDAVPLLADREGEDVCDYQ